MPPERWHRLARRDHSHAVAEFEDQIRDRRAAPCRRDAPPRSSRRCHPETATARIGTPVSAARETKNLAMSSALRSLARRPGSDAAEPSTGLIDRAGFPEQQQAVPGVEPDQRRRQRVRESVPHGHQVHAGRQAGDHFPKRGALPVRVSTTSTVAGGAAAGARRTRTMRENTKMQRIGPMMPTRIGDGVPDRGRPVPAASMAACSVGVLVSAPANMPRPWAGETSSATLATTATASAHSTPAAPERVPFQTDPRRPAKNCRPYWMPMP